MSDTEVKSFVIDTNVFIHKPDAILSFRDNEVVVPLWVLEELDKLKTYSDERGRNARHSIRFLDEIIGNGSPSKGVKMENGSVLKILSTWDRDIPSDLNREKVDNKILLTALSLQKEGKQVFFVSKDINARVKATALGIKAVDYEKQKVNFHELYQGYREVEVSEERIKEFRVHRSMEWSDRLAENQFVLFKQIRGNAVDIGRYDSARNRVVRVSSRKFSINGIKPLNEQQTMAFNLLLDKNIQLVTLVGKAGTGKTLLALASGLKRVVEDKAYSRVLVSRPVVPMGKDIGYLPGAKEEKLSNWMQPLFDNLDYLLTVNKKDNLKNLEWLTKNNLLEIEALTYIRGRSLPNQFIIIDEAQNLSPHEVKTIVSRAGEGTKVVLTGDPYQIDNPYLDANSNGLTYLVEAFKGQPIFGHVTLQRSERSDLAELAAELL